MAATLAEADERDFNPHPRTEGDQLEYFPCFHSYHFNPHPRTEGDRRRGNSDDGKGRFQPTPSHGG